MGKQHLGLKILVIVMGILIIIGAAVVAYTIISRLAAGGKVTEPVSARSAAVDTQAAAKMSERLRDWKPRPLKAFGEITAKIPAGAVVEDMRADRRRLVLRLREISGSQSLYIFNAATGERLGIIRLQAE